MAHKLTRVEYAELVAAVNCLHARHGVIKGSESAVKVAINL